MTLETAKTEADLRTTSSKYKVEFVVVRVTQTGYAVTTADTAEFVRMEVVYCGKKS